MATKREDVSVRFSLVDGVSAGLKNITKNLTEAGKSVFFITEGAQRAVGALKALTGFNALSDGVEAAASFEDAVARIGAATGATGAELAAMGDAAAAAAEKTRFTALESAEALTALAREGFNASEAVGALPAALALAQAQSISTTDAVKALAATMDQFGLAANESTRAADVLQAAAQKGGTSLAELTAGLEQAGPIAKQSGLSFEQTAAALAAFAQAGIEGGKAGGALRQILSALSDPASKFAQELTKIGISSRDFNTVIAQLATKGKLGADAINALGDRGTIALRTLLTNGGGSLQQLIAIIEESGGAAARASDAMNSTFAAAMARISNAFGDLKRELVTPLLEPLAAELEGATAKLRAFATTPEFEAIKEALRTLFVEGIQAVKDFAAEFDFKAALSGVKEFASEAKAQFKALADDAASAAATVKTAFNGIGVLFNGLQTGAAGAATLLASSLQKVIALKDPMRTWSADLQQALDDLARRGLEETNQQADQLEANLNALGIATGDAAAAVADAGDAAATTAPKFASVAEQAKALWDGVKGAGAELEAVGPKATAAADAVGSAGAQLAQLSTEIAKAAAAGIPPTEAQIAALGKLESQATSTSTNIVETWKQVSATFQGSQAPLEGAAAAAGKVAENIAAAGEAGADMGAQVQQGAQQVTSAAGGIAGLIKALNDQFAATSETARLLFVEYQRSAVRAETTIRGVITAILSAEQATQRIIDGQKAQAAGLLQNLQAFAAEGEAAGARIGNAFQRFTEGDLRDMAIAIREGRSGLNALNQADLDALGAAADAAADKVAQIGEEARNAAAELARLSNSLQDELDRAAGDDEAIARRNYEDRIRQIEELGRRSGLEGQQRLEEARARARLLLEQDLANIEKRRRAEQQANAEDMRERQQIAEVDRRRSDPAQPARGGNAGGTSGGRGAGDGNASAPPVSITVQTRGTFNLSPAEAEQLARRLEPELNRIRNLRR
jgi:TP901 family phage tail tape measure protein